MAWLKAVWQRRFSESKNSSRMAIISTPEKVDPELSFGW
jgi:hypothetical protein